MPEKFEPYEEPTEKPKEPEIPRNKHLKKILGAREKYIEQNEILARPLSGQSLSDLKLTRNILREVIGNVQIGFCELAEGIYDEAYAGETKKQRKELDRLNEELEIVEGLIRKKGLKE